MNRSMWGYYEHSGLVEDTVLCEECVQDPEARQTCMDRADRENPNPVFKKIPLPWKPGLLIRCNGCNYVADTQSLIPEDLDGICQDVANSMRSNANNAGVHGQLEFLKVVAGMSDEDIMAMVNEGRRPEPRDPRVYRVYIREVHISHRLIHTDQPVTDKHELLELAAEADEVMLEYSHTLDSEHHTAEDVTNPGKPVELDW